MIEAAFTQELNKTISVLQAMGSDLHLTKQLTRIVHVIIDALEEDRKILFCGNGGSAADAQHLAGEFVGRYLKDRPPLRALALTADTSLLTAIANDYGYNFVFSRQIEALADAGDVLIVYSTSGKSQSIVEAVKAAKAKGVTTIAFLGQALAEVGMLADLCFNVPSTETPRIQEAHLTLGHIFCGVIEQHFFNDKAHQPLALEDKNAPSLYQL